MAIPGWSIAQVVTAIDSIEIGTAAAIPNDGSRMDYTPGLYI
jgi:hypothetical protein